MDKRRTKSKEGLRLKLHKKLLHIRNKYCRSIHYDVRYFGQANADLDLCCQTASVEHPVRANCFAPEQRIHRGDAT